MDGRGNLVPEKQELNQPKENGSFFNYDPLEVQPIPRYSNESLVQATRDMVNNGELPGMEIGKFVAKAFREAVQHTINKADSEKGDSSDLGHKLDPGFYRRRTPDGKPNGNVNDLVNKHPGEPPKDSINSHRNPDGGYSHRNPDIPPIPKTPASEDWTNKHPGQKPDPWRPTDEGNRTQGEQAEDREQKVHGQQAQDRVEGQQAEDGGQKVHGQRAQDRVQGQQGQDAQDGQQKKPGQPPTDKEPINEHHNENKPANPDKPKPGFTCEDLENAEGKLPPSKLPPRRCPEFFFENPVKPR